MRALFDICVIPTQPGIYLLEDFSGNVTYVGISKDLRERLNYHFIPQPGCAEMRNDFELQAWPKGYSRISLNFSRLVTSADLAPLSSRPAAPAIRLGQVQGV